MAYVKWKIYYDRDFLQIYVLPNFVGFPRS